MSRQTFIDDVRANGGATWHWSRPVPASGFVVSHGVAFSEKVKATILDDENATADLVQRFIERNDFALERPASFLGGWIEDGYLYLDAVEVISDGELAYQLGVARNQKAIYDLSTGTEIPTGGTGE